MANTVLRIIEILQPIMPYIAVATVTFLVSRVKTFKHVLWIPVAISAVYLICLFAKTVAGL